MAKDLLAIKKHLDMESSEQDEPVKTDFNISEAKKRLDKLKEAAARFDAFLVDMADGLFHSVRGSEYEDSAAQLKTVLLIYDFDGANKIIDEMIAKIANDN